MVQKLKPKMRFDRGKENKLETSKKSRSHYSPVHMLDCHKTARLEECR